MEQKSLHVLLVDDDASFAPALAELIAQEGFSVRVAGSLAEARREFNQHRPDIIFLDLVLPDGNGMDLVEHTPGFDESDIKLVLITGFGSVNAAVKAMRVRAADFLTKPLDVQYLARLLRKLRLEYAHLGVEPLRSVDGHPTRLGPLVGASPAMQDLYEKIRRVADTDAPVLIVGESGTGKELVGRAIHDASSRAGQPYISVNAGALAPSLAASELFGHERGSFTGAHGQHLGHFERAREGTVFLDELAEMPQDLQVYLLRLLENRRLTRVGGSQEIDIDVRIIAATNYAPDEALQSGRLRSDLFFRLSGFVLRVPPLRDRESDVELLARHFLGQLNDKHGTKKSLSDDATRHLSRYPWPGNVRELRNLLERAFILADECIHQEHLPLANEGSGVAGNKLAPSFEIGESLEEVGKGALMAALRHYQGNKKRAAESLGVSLKTIYNRLKRYERA